MMEVYFKGVKKQPNGLTIENKLLKRLKINIEHKYSFKWTN